MCCHADVNRAAVTTWWIDTAKGSVFPQVDLLSFGLFEHLCAFFLTNVRDPLLNRFLLSVGCFFCECRGK